MRTSRSAAVRNSVPLQMGIGWVSVEVAGSCEDFRVF
jgi:hypothetical protein